MSKFHKIEDGFYAFQCPGCRCAHWIRTAGQPSWTFNGDIDNPTVSPSILVWGHKPEKRCHLFVRDGKIQFLEDCFHNFRGQTVDVPDFLED